MSRVQRRVGPLVARRALFRRNGKNRLWIDTGDSQQRSRSPAWLLATLLPTLESAHRHAKQRRKLRLGKPSLLASLDDRRRNVAIVVATVSALHEWPLAPWTLPNLGRPCWARTSDQRIMSPLL